VRKKKADTVGFKMNVENFTLCRLVWTVGGHFILLHKSPNSNFIHAGRIVQQAFMTGVSFGNSAQHVPKIERDKRNDSSVKATKSPTLIPTSVGRAFSTKM
jgi:hypothetical protein